LFWYWNYWTRCLACRVSRGFLFMRRERIYVPFRESGWSKKARCSFSKTKIEKIGQNLKYDLKYCRICSINVELFDTWLLIIN
jgi:hypothetical protein